MEHTCQGMLSCETHSTGVYGILLSMKTFFEPVLYTRLQGRDGALEMKDMVPRV